MDSFARGSDTKVLRGVKHEKKEVKSIGQGSAKSDKQTPLRRRRDFHCAPPASYKDQGTSIVLLEQQHSHILPNDVLCSRTSGCCSRHDIHFFQPCSIKADVVHLPSLLSLGGPRSALSPAQTSSITQRWQCDSPSDEIVRHTPCAYLCLYRVLNSGLWIELHVHR